MSYKTRDQLTQGVLETIGLVSGIGVQTYTEPKINKSIQQTFDMLFRKHDWKHMCHWVTYTLDGSTGKITGNISSYLTQWQHAREFYVGDTEIRIPMPVRKEHLHVSGSQPLFVVPLPWDDADALNKAFKFYPITSTGDVDIYIKKKPADFGANATVPLPSDLMEYGTAWQLLAGDGINPDAADRAKLMFEVVYKDYVSELTQPIGHGPARRRTNEVVIGSLL